MTVLCINRNNWHEYEGNMCGYLHLVEDGIQGITYMEECEVIRSFTDSEGDLFYVIDGKGEQGWEAECFQMQYSYEELLQFEEGEFINLKIKS